MADEGEEVVVGSTSSSIESPELERESTSSPVQEVEEESFVKVDLKEGLEQLNEALKRGELPLIRSCYTNLIKTFPTAVSNFMQLN